MLRKALIAALVILFLVSCGWHTRKIDQFDVRVALSENENEDYYWIAEHSQGRILLSPKITRRALTAGTTWRPPEHETILVNAFKLSIRDDPYQAEYVFLGPGKAYRKDSLITLHTCFSWRAGYLNWISIQGWRLWLTTLFCIISLLVYTEGDPLTGSLEYMAIAACVVLCFVWTLLAGFSLAICIAFILVSATILNHLASKFTVVSATLGGLAFLGTSADDWFPPFSTALFATTVGMITVPVAAHAARRLNVRTAGKK